MEMRMEPELLTPTMQHTEEANLRAEKSRIAGHFEKGLRTGAEQKIVDDLLVLQHQWGQAAGERKDHVHVAGGEKFSSARRNPLFPSGGLTLRAVAISTANGENPISCLMVSIFYWRVERGKRRAAKATRPFDSPLTLCFQQCDQLVWWSKRSLPQMRRNDGLNGLQFFGGIGAGIDLSG